MLHALLHTKVLASTHGEFKKIDFVYYYTVLSTELIMQFDLYKEIWADVLTVSP